MISVSEAEKIVLQNARLLPYESISLPEAYGRVLRESISSDRDQPAFNKSTMDGIAISSSAFSNGAHEFMIEGVALAGQKQGKLKRKNGCFKIMTGAVVPHGCDCVIPIEEIVIKGKTATITDTRSIKRGRNIRIQGADQ